MLAGAAEQFKARLPMAKRAFLNMAGGVLEGDQLIVQCDNDLVKNTLSKDDVVEVLRQTASDVLGRSIAVRVVTKSASAQRPAAGGRGSCSAAGWQCAGAAAETAGRCGSSGTFTEQDAGL